MTSVVEIKAIMSGQKLLERYKAGECEQVWQELKNLGNISEKSVKEEALGIARETMKRVRYNFNFIANNLIQLGFEFEEPQKVLVSVKANASEYLDEFEQQWRILPLSVRAWYEVIHSVKNLYFLFPVPRSLNSQIILL